MFGHFSGIYKYAANATAIESAFLRSFTVFPFSFLTAESFWLYLFFAVSGYLVASSKVESMKDVCRKAIVRFFRFFIPIIGAILIAFLLGRTIGYYNQELKTIIDNPWYFTSYQEVFTINDLLLEPVKVIVLGTCRLDSPLWVMRDMLLSSILIYGISYMIKSSKTSTIKRRGCILVCILLTGSIGLKRYVLFGCICGACGKWFEEYLHNILKFKFALWINSLALIGGFLLNNCYVTAVLFTVWIATLKEQSAAHRLRVFENKLTVWLGSISLGIFVLHWPIYNSVGALPFYRFYGQINNGLLMALTFSLSFIVVILCAIAFRLTFEHFTTFICKKVDSRLKYVGSSEK